MKWSRRFGLRCLDTYSSASPTLVQWLRALGLFGSGVHEQSYGLVGEPVTELFNTRYRILLLSVSQALRIPRVNVSRNALIDLMMREMSLVLPPLLRWLQSHVPSSDSPGVFRLEANFPPVLERDCSAALAENLAQSAALVSRLSSNPRGDYLDNVLQQVNQLDANRKSIGV
jgi:hypothetical protein